MRSKFSIMGLDNTTIREVNCPTTYKLFTIPCTEVEILVVSHWLIQKHYTNAPRIAMVFQQSKIKGRCYNFMYLYRNNQAPISHSGLDLSKYVVFDKSDSEIS